MEVVGYNVTLSHSSGDSLFRYFTSFEALVEFSSPYAAFGYSMFVVPVFE